MSSTRATRVLRRRIQAAVLTLLTIYALAFNLLTHHENSIVTTTTSTTIVIHVETVSTHHALVSALIMQRTERVQACEEGHWGWHVNGWKYQGGLGWLHATWLAYRAPSFPVNMADATPQQQAWAMAHFVGAYLHFWPDQHGCTGGY